MTEAWIAALAAHEHAGRPAVLVTVVEARGSTPRGAGAKFVVTAAAQDGSIGGGTLEYRCTTLARGFLRERASTPLVQDFALGPALGQCCGGHVRVLFEPLFVDAWSVALFGAGHVGQALVRLLADLPCRVRWIDARPDQFPPLPPSNVVVCASQTPEAEIARLASGASVLVMTHDHALDYRIVQAALQRDDLGFVGLIGSATKAAGFRARLIRAAIDPGRLVCPVGVPGVGGKLPAEIAIAVAAQLLQVRGAPAMQARDNVLALQSPAGCDGACASCVAVSA